MSRSWRWAGLLALACAAAARAQLEPPVRRALPVTEPPVGRAVPFDEPTATPTPRAVPRAIPQPTAPVNVTPRPVAPETDVADTPAPAPVPTESAEQRQINYANGLFGRKLYDLAAPEYEKFIGLYPRSSERPGAFFYLGECYRALGKVTAERTSFQSVLNDYPESEFAGPAAFGVAEILFGEKEYGSALPLFHRAAAKSKASALALSARYFEARCLESLDRKDEARDIYQQVIEVKDPNPYRDDCRLASGSILLARGRKADALKQFEALANETTKPAIRAEATVRAGMVAVDLQQPEKGKIDKAMSDRAIALLQRGRALPEAGRWKGIAEIGLLRLQFQAGQYAQVIADYKRDQEQIPEEVRPEMMLLVANSQRQLGHYKEAGDLYQQIVQKYPTREEAKDAQYQRLISLYNSNDASLRAEADDFLKANPTGERADQVKLLEAEALYKAQDFAAAAPLYTALRASQLSTKLRAESAYKLGWCYVQSKQTPNVIEAFSYFLKAFPENPQIPSALAQRALAYQQTQRYDAALADLNLLLGNYPKAREREAALQQKALIQGQQDNPKGMIASFQQLLKEFPKTAAAAQANYYIGKAAFESKDYELAINALDQARTLNSQEYYLLSTLRIMSSYLALKQREPLAAETSSFMEKQPNARVPAEILEWLGIDAYNRKDYPAAAKYLTALSQSDNLATVKPDFRFYLADAQLKLRNYAEAETFFEQYIPLTDDPAAKAKALLLLGQAKIGLHEPEDAQKIAEQIMTLQPEGRVNAEARLLAGDVEIERQQFEAAAKAYLGVALLYDDPAITPRALDKAAKAYAKAGKVDEASRVSKDLQKKYPDYSSPDKPLT